MTANLPPPPAGQIPSFLTRRLGYSTRRIFTYGECIPIGIGGQSLLPTDPNDIFHVLVTNDANYVKSRNLSTPHGARRVGGGLISRTGPAHVARRRTLQPLYHQRSVEAYTHTMADQTRRLVATWKPGAELDLGNEMSRLNIRILLASTFGELPEADILSLIAAIRDRRTYTERVYFSRIPFYNHLPTPAATRNNRARDLIHHLTAREIQRRRSQPQDDLLSRMMTLVTPEGSPLADADIQDEILALMSTGHETITEWITWLWILIARHPALAERCRAEWSRPNPTPGDCPYVDAFIDEALRLYPPTWIFARVPLATDTLPSGARIDPGNTLLLCQFLLHRHPAFFPEPEQFNPDRFLAPDAARWTGRAFFPFGAGPHRCIGDRFARTEILTLLPIIDRAFRFVPLPGQPCTPEPSITLRPKGGFRVVAHPADRGGALRHPTAH